MRPFVFIVACVLLARFAHAKDNLCVSQAESAQEWRKAGRLLESQQALRACTADVCPKVIRKDCQVWLDEVEQEVPSVVVRVVDKQGIDVPLVSLRIDDKPIPINAAVLAMPLDPGPHTIGVATQTHTLKQTVVLRVREHARVVTFTEPRLAPIVAEQPIPRPRTRSQVLPWSLLAGSGAALASFAYFGMTARNDAEDLRSSCAPDCSDDKVYGVKYRLWIADASLGVGISLAAAATWWWIVDRRQERPPIELRVAGDGAHVMWQGAF